MRTACSGRFYSSSRILTRISSCILSRVEGTQLWYSLVLVPYWEVTSHVEEHSKGVSRLVEAIPDVAAC